MTDEEFKKNHEVLFCKLEVMCNFLKDIMLAAERLKNPSIDALMPPKNRRDKE